MQLTKTLQAQVLRLAHKYGNGQGDDLAQECFKVLWQRPEEESSFALRIARQTILNALKKEELRAAAMSTSDPNFVDVCYDDRVIDVDRCVADIHNRRLKAIVDDYVDGVTLSAKDRRYLCDHRKQLADPSKYLKPISAWMWLVIKCEPFHRNAQQLAA